MVFGLTIGDVRKCTDEEHSIWSGGKEIFDLLQCGCEERRCRKKKERENNKYRIWEIIICDKMKIIVFNKILENNNNNIIESVKHFIAKKCSY